jgi:hypothetical protein
MLQSEDGFEDFRAWLVSLGREAFELVLQDVEALAQVPLDESRSKVGVVETCVCCREKSLLLKATNANDFAMSLAMFVMGGLILIYGLLFYNNGYPWPLFHGAILIGAFLTLIGGNGVLQSVTAPFRAKTDW